MKHITLDSLLLDIQVEEPSQTRWKESYAKIVEISQVFAKNPARKYRQAFQGKQAEDSQKVLNI